MLENVKGGLRAISSKFKDYRQYDGNAKQICRKIVKECWNGEYLQTGSRMYPEYWTRDFGLSIEALLKIGYKREAEKTLTYALEKFKEHNKITTHIAPNGNPVNFPTVAADSLPFFINSLRLVKSDLISENIAFFNHEVIKYYNVFFNHNLGIIKRNKHFSSMKDYYVRKSSMYSNCMLAMLSNDLEELGLNNPFKNYDFPKIFKKRFWTGKYFLDDLSGRRYVAGDANTFPFWCNIFNSKEMFRLCLEKIQQNNLDVPFPLKYTKKRRPYQEILLGKLVPNFEGNSVWIHLGACFIDVVRRYDKKLAKTYISQYKRVIEHNKNFLELFNPDGTPYKTLFYKADGGMLWAAKYLSWL